MMHVVCMGQALGNDSFQPHNQSEGKQVPTCFGSLFSHISEPPELFLCWVPPDMRVRFMQISLSCEWSTFMLWYCNAQLLQISLVSIYLSHQNPPYWKKWPWREPCARTSLLHDPQIRVNRREELILNLNSSL